MIDCQLQNHAGKKGGMAMLDEAHSQAVVVTDIHMPFSSMVIFMVKWAIAAIPALIILMVMSATFWGILTGLLFPWSRDKGRQSVFQSDRAPAVVLSTTVSRNRSPLTQCED
jgi:hypothetical protein